MRELHFAHTAKQCSKKFAQTSPIALESQWMLVPNQPIPTYGYYWSEHQSDY
jgi:hypothetical protein